MMIMRKIALRYLKRQKRHTMTAILVVTLAVGMITAVMSILYGAMETQKEVIIAENGRHHVRFNVASLGTDGKKLGDLYTLAQKYSRNAVFSESCVDFSVYFQGGDTNFRFLQMGGYRQGAGAEHQSGVVRSVDPSNPLELLNDETSIWGGRLPQSSGEIAVSKSNYEELGFPAMGSEVLVTVLDCKRVEGAEDDSYRVTGHKVYSFIITGVLDYNCTVLHSSDPFWAENMELADVNVSARFYPDAYDLDQIMMGLEQESKGAVNDYSLQEELLNMEGVGVKAKAFRVFVLALVAAFALVILASCRLIIDCIFEISSKERVRQFGILVSAGASKWQMAGLFFWESLFIGGIGSVLGTALGIGLYWAFMEAVRNINGLQWFGSSGNFKDMIHFSLSPVLLILGIVFGMVWVFFSSYGTGMRIVKKSPAEAISGNASDSLGKKIPKPSRLAKKLGVSIQLASVNAKRNRKRSILTVISVATGMIFFSGFSYLMHMVEESVRIEVEAAPYADFVFSVNGENREKELIAVMEALPFVTEAHGVYEVPLSDKVSKKGYVLVGVDREMYEKLNAPVSYDDLNRMNAVLYGRTSNSRLTATYSFDNSFPEYPYKLGFQAYRFDKYATESDGDVYRRKAKDFEFIHGEVYVAAECFTDLFDYDGKLICTEDQMKTIFKSLIANSNKSVIQVKAQEGFVSKLEGFLRSRRDVLSYQCYMHEKTYSKVMLQIIKMAGFLLIALIGMIAAVNVINIIITSILNRRNETGLLMAVGMTKKQLMLSNLLEAGSYGAKAVVWAAAILFLALFSAKRMYISFPEELTPVINSFFNGFVMLKYLIISFLITIGITSAVSVYPLRKIWETSIVDSIRHID